MLIKNKLCQHCQAILSNSQERFCCNGCEQAFAIINDFGLENYYQIRENNLKQGSVKPQSEQDFDLSEFVISDASQSNHLSLILQDLQCAGCVWLIENILVKNPLVINARINLSQRVLKIEFSGHISNANQIMKRISDIGYKFLPFDQDILNAQEKKYNDSILKALAVAGFGAGNIMLFSFALWFSDIENMGKSMHQFFQFLSGLIALPVVIYSGRIFFISAFKALKAKRTNMDLPISLAIILAGIISVFQAFKAGDHVYFDSAVMLIFFLLIGRFLDHKARKKAFNIATQFSLLNASFARVITNEGLKIMPSNKVEQGMMLLVASGEKIACDGKIIDGESEIDVSLLTGETILKNVRVNDEVFAGTINISQPLKILVKNPFQKTLLSQIIELVEKAQSCKSPSNLIANRLAKIYTPLVHALALLTFSAWYFFLNADFWQALLNATAVLIITCPCALALAIPIVQTIVISQFITKNLLIKNAEALEKINEIQTIVFDKTGTLTTANPNLTAIYLWQDHKISELTSDQRQHYLDMACALAQNSSHPVCKALCQNNFNFKKEINLQEIIEEKSRGLRAKIINNDKQLSAELFLGRADFCKITKVNKFQEQLLEINKTSLNLTVFMRIDDKQIVFVFADKIKEDAKMVIDHFKKLGLKIILLSGDNKAIVSKVANELEIAEFYGEYDILQKSELVKKLVKQSKVMMVGDGLNDAPALSLAEVSLSFNNASDLSKNIADILINSNNLKPMISLFKDSKKAFKLMKQNLALALIYNLLALPFAMMGMIVPLLAALAMSSSSLLVIINSLRIKN